MKRIILALLFLLIISPIAFAEEVAAVHDNIFTNNPESQVELHGYLEYDDVPSETIYLERQPEELEPDAILLMEPGSKNGLNLKAPTRIESKSLITAKTRQNQALDVKNIDAISKFYAPEYHIAPVSSSYSTKTGNVSYGTNYDMSMSRAQMNFSTGVFTRYEGKHFALTSSLSKNAKTNADSNSNYINFAPELKITKRLSLLDVIQTDASQTYKSNEIVLRYRPHMKKFADDVLLELGAGQSFYEDNYINSAVRFSTRFKL